MGDKEKLRTPLATAKKIDWKEEVRLKDRIHVIQVQRHGYALGGPGSYGWSMGDTARLLDESKTNVSRDIKLAKALKQYPELLECQNKSNAQRIRWYFH